MSRRAAAGDPRLLELMRREIGAHGPITFARFMELALYHERYGYYAAGPARLGRHGDYFTASDAGRDFGRCMARQVAELDRHLGRPDPFDLLEFGAGRGLLARDLLDSLDPDLARRARYTMVDRSPAMRAAASRQVPEARVLAPEELDGEHHGCALAVELFDALPVHRVRRRDGRLHEIFVDVDAGGELCEIEARPGAVVRAWAERYGAARDEGSEAEVAPAMAAAFAAVAGSLARGAMILVDYGDRAPALYGARPRGTLLAYHRHVANEELLSRVGQQDLTAHVNFTCLQDLARERGLAVLGLTTQDRFLIANGILESFEQPDVSSARDPRRVKRRLQAMQLIHPCAMGRAFRVLMLAKGLAPLRLTGLLDPFARDSERS